MALATQKEKIIWGGKDSFTHMLIVGPTRCGKTATVLKPMIYQLLLAKKRGMRLGLSVIEPKGDVARMVADVSSGMGLKCNHIDPLDENTDQFNVMEGNIEDVTEATVVVLKSLFGKQEAFFAIIQELSTRKVTELLKRLHGDNINLFDVVRTLRNLAELERAVVELKSREGDTDLVQFFESELLGAQREKYQQFVIGLRAQMENITSSSRLKRILEGKSSFNLDEHFETGGILAINTAMGKLRNAGDAFGQFAMMHLMSATYRRGGIEDTRIPHYLFVDEASRYMSAEMERFLSIAAEYKTAGIFAIQSLAQLEVESGKISGKAMKQAFMTSCRNKIAFTGLAALDAKEFQEEFGKRPVIVRQSTFSPNLFAPSIMPNSYRDTDNDEYRYTYTQLMDGLPRFHYVAKLLQDGHPQKPQIGKGIFIPKNWKEILLDENSRAIKDIKQDKFNLIHWASKNYGKLVKLDPTYDKPEDDEDEENDELPFQNKVRFIAPAVEQKELDMSRNSKVPDENAPETEIATTSFEKEHTEEETNTRLKTEIEAALNNGRSIRERSDKSKNDDFFKDLI
ncbi:type IV secretory system conjugative DNA transfer family protein [Paenibacillus sp. LjRoot153]|uniref:type IV secretory system conjugative DNA transfer family protein n=1 Tax=Paenibacillus sp. LjRoot153 TaxID=3342270 RepID=UPI003ECF926B